jgi:hypothetical protein
MFAPLSRNDLGNCFRLTLRPFYDDKLSNSRIDLRNTAVKIGLGSGLHRNSRLVGRLVIWRSLPRVCCGVGRSKAEARSDKSRSVFHAADILSIMRTSETISAIFESDRFGGPTFRWTEN